MLISSQRFDTEAAHVADTFDYIICGAGSAGSALAGRLCEDLSASILVLEAGGDDDSEIIGDPNRWFMALGSDLDWGFATEPNLALNGRTVPYNMGKVLGGGSSINVGTWSCGHKADWDHFASETGESAWSYDAVRRLYVEAIEAWTGEADRLRGRNGAMHIQPAPSPHPFALAVLKAAEAADMPRFANANGALMESNGGCAIVDEIVLNGRRRSVYRAYLQPRLSQANVTVITGANVNRVIIEGRRAVGVECTIGTRTHVFRAASDVVLSLGAINTPRVLMHSGVGDAEHLRALNIPVVENLPAVGDHLHDHVAFGCVWAANDVDLPHVPRSQTVCFWKTDPRLDSPDAYAYARGGPQITPENAAGRSLPASTWSLVVGLRLQGKGRIRLTGAHVNAPISIDNGYLSGQDELLRVVAAAEMARTIGSQPALAAFTAYEFAPGNLTHAELEQYLRLGLGSYWHQCGTARSGKSASTSVVDGQLRVHGLTGLRVADASVFPRVTSGNTMAPSVVVGELAARFLNGSR